MTYEENDNFEHNDDGMAEHLEESGFPVEATLRFTYESSDGEITERIVEVRRFGESAWGNQILGFCRTRQADRTFNIDRIRQCSDASTGTQVSDVYEHLFSIYQETSDFSLDNVMTEQRDTLRALAYLLDVGGRLQSHGLPVLGIACRKLSGDSRIIDTMISPYMEHVACHSIQAFRQVVGRLNKTLNTEAKDAVFRLATKVANLDANINQAEQEALDYMSKRFAKAE